MANPTARDRAIAKLAELTNTPPFVVRAAFDEFGIVAVGDDLVSRYAAGPSDDVAREIAETVISQLRKLTG